MGPLMFRPCISDLDCLRFYRRWKRVKSHTKCLLKVHEPRVTITRRSLIYFCSLLFFFFFFPKINAILPRGVSLIRIGSYRSTPSYLLCNICFSSFSAQHSCACLEITRPIMRKNPILVTAGSVHGACNKGSSKVGKDFCSCARIMQYCHDNIKFFFPPILLEGLADIMIAYIGALQGNCILCQGGQHLTWRATLRRSKKCKEANMLIAR